MGASGPASRKQGEALRGGRGSADVDVVVIGGGVNGTGVARDAAMRGLSVALFERNDLAFGASGNSSGMIHGGVRYLSADPAVTETSCRDSGHIQAIAPHLLFRTPFVMPISQAQARLFPFIDAFFEAYDRYQPLKRGKPHARVDAAELLRLEPGLVGDFIGGITFDEWGIDGSRLCAANAVDAHERGAKMFVGHTVEAIERGPAGEVEAVLYRDRHTQVAGRITTHAVVNATGAWGPITASLGALPAESARVRPGKGVHVVLERKLSNFAIMSDTIDGRTIFIEPWQNVSVIGTTDDDYYGDLDQIRATSEEVRYLVEGIAKVFPAVRKARIINTYVGVRPTLHEYGKHEDALSRDHRIVDHAADGADGMYSMIGGKLASYRLFAQEMVDRLSVRFGVTRNCHTHCTALPGGDRQVDASALARDLAIDATAARRLAYRHGGRALRIAERIKRKPAEGRLVCVCESVLEAEVRQVVRTEFARSVADVSRRTRLGLGPCGGMRCAGRCGAVVADELGMPPALGNQQALQFLERQALSRSCALGPEQARQEALAIAHIRAQLGFSRSPESTSVSAYKDQNVVARRAAEGPPTGASPSASMPATAATATTAAPAGGEG